MTKEALQKWLLPPTPPEMIRVTTGDQHVIAEQTEIFFTATVTYLGATPDHIRAGLIKHVPFELTTPGTDSVLTDQQLTLLMVQDLPIASALEVRDDFNHILGYWTSYLTPEVEGIVRRKLGKEE